MVLLQLVELVASVPDRGPQLLAVARSDDLELLRALYLAEKTEPYQDVVSGMILTKVFRRGGPFEYYVPPHNEDDMFIDIGTKEERLEALIRELTEKVNIEWDAVLANTIPCNNGAELIALVQRQLTYAGEVNDRQNSQDLVEDQIGGSGANEGDTGEHPDPERNSEEAGRAAWLDI
jgi:hypothetical protein